jgi:hypothetical protein
VVLRLASVDGKDTKQYSSTYAGDAGDRVRDTYAASVSCLFPFGVDSVIAMWSVFTVFVLLCADAARS